MADRMIAGLPVSRTANHFSTQLDIHKRVNRFPGEVDICWFFNNHFRKDIRCFGVLVS
jgi:hypothetical protein